MCPDCHFAQTLPSQNTCFGIAESEQNGSLGLCEAIVRQGSLVVVDREVVVDVAIDVVVVEVDSCVVVIVDVDRDVVVVVDSTALLLCRPLMLLLLTSTGMLLLLTLTAMLLLTLTGLLLLLLLTVLPCCCAVGCRTNWRSSTCRT